MSEQNFYEILEVYPAASKEEIETAFRMLLYKYHPDHNSEREEWSHVMTAKVVDAYQCLSDPERRKLYNFLIYSPLKKKAGDRKFMFFQGKQKEQWQAALLRFNAGVVLFPRQKAKAGAKFKEAIHLWPKFPEALYNLGLCLIELKKYDEARSYFNQVKNLNPKEHEIRRTLRRLDELTKK